MIEQLIAGVVGFQCGRLIEWEIDRIIMAYAISHDIEFKRLPLRFCIAATTGAYLFIQWFC